MAVRTFSMMNDGRHRRASCVIVRRRVTRTGRRSCSMSHVGDRRSALRRVVDTGMCAGCGACTALDPQIEMAIDDAGFIRPSLGVEMDSHQHDVFVDVCPGRRVESTIEASSRHVLWGPYESVLTAHATDPDLRHAGASGGALSALLVELLESGRVDGIIHVAASDEPAIANRTVVSRTAVDVMAAAGSRYAPSAPLAGITERLDGTTIYAFVGKPCDVSTLRALARHDRRIDQQIPYMLSFFCAGVPSQHGAEAILSGLDVAPDDVETFRFRGNGWPGAATARRRDGTEESMTYVQSWGGILSKHLQARCKICPDGTGTTADVVSADAWETDSDGYPLFEERDGVSLVMTRTSKGEELVDSAVDDGRLVADPLDVDAIEAMQPGQFAKAVYSPIRQVALAMTGRRVPRFVGFDQARRVRAATAKRALREFAGTARRRIRSDMNS